ncbi:Dabb family protein [Motiliproteus sp. MSK22-1]|uniref:Dabb family protein n=1 Tax=Motiliproteus sp. MSK22-1 TaxID=1897630 RepID=UPI000978945F|nr:Dabb family protein [Motiliproteus sp. MSK22-1]OMH29518.1 hypothetical protein BGP75_19460 [Motiliproteus sp. MSK22-1]
MISHMVLLKCRNDVPEQQLTAMFDALAALVNKIPGLESYCGGENNSPEGIARGYTHAFYMQFADAQSRDNYLPHPDHEVVKKLIAAVLEDCNEPVLVIDF